MDSSIHTTHAPKARISANCYAIESETGCWCTCFPSESINSSDVHYVLCSLALLLLPLSMESRLASMLGLGGLQLGTKNSSVIEFVFCSIFNECYA